MSRRPTVSVLGSLNADITVNVPRLPAPGQTVLGSPAAIGPGGKGANQAVAAARLGAATRMHGCLGDDEFGRMLAGALAAEGVDASGVRTAPGVATGVALITVDSGGENTIAVAPGANAEVGEQDAAGALTAPCDVLVLSAEIPAAALAAGLAAAGAVSAATVLNLAPAPPGGLALLAAGVDWLVVNESEAAALLGREVAGPEQARRAAADLAGGWGRTGLGRDQAGAAPGSRAPGPGARHVVVTLGAAGAVLDGQAGPVAVPGHQVRAVDSVGAGDAFVGALAVAVAMGADPVLAVRAACAAGAAAVTRRGAQAGLPRPADVLAATGSAWPFQP